MAPRSTHASTALMTTERRQQGAAGAAGGDRSHPAATLRGFYAAGVVTERERNAPVSLLSH